MPRTYVPSRNKQYKKYESQNIQDAIKEYKNTNSTLKDIGKKYNISKSVLHRHITRVMRPHGRPKVLNEEIEQYLIKYINICSEWGYPLDTYDLRYLIKGYLDRMGVEIKRFKNNMPGPDYVDCFLTRHKDVISKRISQNIKRARAAVSRDMINQYFDYIQISLEGVPLPNIINYDETNLSDDPGKKKIITKRGVKYPERVMNHSKTSTSLMIAASADGTLLPSYVVYKAIHIYDTWRQNGPQKCRYNRTSSGWFDGNTFEDWVETVALPYFEDKQGKKILIGDNLSSHLSINLIRKCKEKEVFFVFLPANSTHLTQPLDVAFFRPMKSAWRDILFNWKKTDGRTQASVPKCCFPLLLKKLFNKLETNLQHNILAGFSKTGISPLNREKVLERLPGNTTRKETCTDEDKNAIEETVLKLLTEMRYGNGNTTNITTKQKKKKINVQPGKSVGENSDTDYVESETSETNSRINEDTDPGALETNIEAHIVQQTKNPNTTKRKIKKQQPSTSGITKKKTIVEKQERKTKIKKEKISRKQKTVMKVKKENKYAAVNLNQDLLLYTLQDNLNVNNMPIIFEGISISDDIKNNHNNCKVISILNEDREEISYESDMFSKPSAIDQFKHKKPTIKGKGVGKKSQTQKKSSDDTIEHNTVNTFILSNDKIEEIYSEITNKKKTKQTSDEESEKMTEVIPEKPYQLKRDDLQTEAEFKLQETKSFNLDIHNESIILDEYISISENLTIENDKIYEDVLNLDNDNKIDTMQINKAHCSSKDPDYKIKKDIILTDYKNTVFVEPVKESKIKMIGRENVTLKKNYEITTGKYEKAKTAKREYENPTEYKVEPEKKKVCILSDKLVTHTLNYCELNKCKKVPINTCIKVPNKNDPKHDSSQSNKYQPTRRKQRYYKNDEEILKDLMDD